MNIWCCSLLRSNLSFRGRSLHLEISFHFVALTKNMLLKTWPCFVLWHIFMWKPQRVSFFYKDTDVEQRVSTFNLRVNYLLIFGAFTWIFLSIRSTTGLCNHPELIGQEHTLLPVPFLEGYKMLLPGSAGSNMSLCGFKEEKEALPDCSQV